MNNWLERLMTMSIQAGILILLLLSLGQATKKHFSLRLRYGLWLLSALRLLVPISFRSALSLMNLLPNAEKIAVQQNLNQLPAAATLQFGDASEPIPAVQAVSERLPVPAVQPAAQAAPDIAAILFWVWIFGVVLVIGLMLHVNLRFYRQYGGRRFAVERTASLPAMPG